jgi:hypothetical protein
MSNRFGVTSSALGIVLAAALFLPAFVCAQTQSDATKKPDPKTAARTDTKAVKTWTLPRLSDGRPDLQGYWTSVSYTPFERPTKYGNREFLTDQEAKDVFNAGVQGSFDGVSGTGDAADDPTSADYDFKTYGLSPWQNGVKPNNRTSLVVDPPDGRIPPLTAEAKERLKGVRPDSYFSSDTAPGEAWNGVVHADHAQDLGVGVTCTALHGGPPIIPGGYNSGLFIVQSAGYVMIETEYGTENRIIPLDGRPHPSANIRQWHGDGRGHWEGDTLVVETTNFRPENTYRGANADALKITEYFTRVAADKIEYKFTIDDPKTWTKPWSVIVPLTPIKGPLWEYACNESNNDAIQILQGARNAEKASSGKQPEGIPISQK